MTSFTITALTLLLIFIAIRLFGRHPLFWSKEDKELYNQLKNEEWDIHSIVFKNAKNSKMGESVTEYFYNKNKTLKISKTLCYDLSLVNPFDKCALYSVKDNQVLYSTDNYGPLLKIFKELVSEKNGVDNYNSFLRSKELALNNKFKLNSILKSNHQLKNTVL